MKVFEEITPIYSEEEMTIALAGLFNDHIIEKIVSFYNPCPGVEWEQVYGSRQIYRTTHLLTYGGGP